MNPTTTIANLETELEANAWYKDERAKRLLTQRNQLAEQAERVCKAFDDNMYAPTAATAYAMWEAVQVMRVSINVNTAPATTPKVCTCGDARCTASVMPAELTAAQHAEERALNKRDDAAAIVAERRATV